jgi:hypothetical protein
MSYRAGAPAPRAGDASKAIAASRRRSVAYIGDAMAEAAE